MTHARRRNSLANLEKALKWSPTVGILGMRQVGKTTLMKKVVKSYFNFDDPSAMMDFERNGKAIIESSASPLGLDEVQKAPFLFDLVKLLVDEKKQMGRFVLSGSVRFSSRRQIRESLTGRTALIELFPFTLAECHSRPASAFLNYVGAKEPLKKLEKHAWATHSQIEHYLSAGGLPGICFRRDAGVRDELFKNHLDTLFGRDLDLVARTKVSMVGLNDLFTLLAQNQGLPLNYSALAREIGVTSPTVKSILKAFEALFLIRFHGQTCFIEDQGLASHVTGFSPTMRRKKFLSYLYHELRCQAAYGFGAQARISEVRNRGGVFVPFLVQIKGHPPLATTFDAEEVPSDKSLKSLTWYRKKSRDALTVAIHLGKAGFVSGSGTLCVPLTWVV